MPYKQKSDTHRRSLNLAGFVCLAGILLTACGGGGGGGGNTNADPAAAAGPDQTVTETSMVQLAGSGSDAEGAVTYSWTQTGGTTVSLSNPAISNPVFTAPSVTASTVLVFQLTVTDTNGATDTDILMITVDPLAAGNTLPTVGAGPDQTVNSGDNVQLAGTGSDAEGAVTFSWSQTGGTTVTLSDATANNPTFTAPTVATGASDVITLQLTVTDTSSATATDTVVVTVNGPTGGGGSGSSNKRISRVDYDYDNNGVMDAVETYTYDSLGRMTRSAYVYTDDGTPNTFVEKEEFDLTFDVTYDSNNRMTYHKFTTPTTITEFTYTYDAGTGLLARADVKVTTGGFVTDTYILYSATGGRIVQGDTYQTSDDSLQLSATYTYNTAGQLIQSVSSNSFGTFTQDFTRDGSGRLDMQVTSSTFDTFIQSHDNVFDTSNRLATRINVNTNPFADQYDNYTETYNYNASNELTSVDFDNNSNGSIDGRAFAGATENAPCIAVHIPALIRKTGQDGIPGSLIGDVGVCLP